MKTAKIAESITGSKLYQKRARAALPKLVRQAMVAAKIRYSDLARELEMPNARNLNYVLGSIGTTMNELSVDWGITVPPIQCLVVRKRDGFPGDGWNKDEFAGLDSRQKELIVNRELTNVFTFQRWYEVLAHFSLEPELPCFELDIESAAQYGGEPESQDHIRLKGFVYKNPQSANVNGSIIASSIEKHLPSGDSADVYFQSTEEWVIVEVKSKISSESDIVRGLYQCVKYKSVLEAMQKASNEPQNARAILALEGRLPERLVALKNLLEIECVELVMEHA